MNIIVLAALGCLLFFSIYEGQVSGVGHNSHMPTKVSSIRLSHRYKRGCQNVVKNWDSTAYSRRRIYRRLHQRKGRSTVGFTFAKKRKRSRLDRLRSLPIAMEQHPKSIFKDTMTEPFLIFGKNSLDHSTSRVSNIQVRQKRRYLWHFSTLKLRKHTIVWNSTFEAINNGFKQPQKEIQLREKASFKNHLKRTKRRRPRRSSVPTLTCNGELSCRDKCHNPRTVSHQTKLSCYCDVDCEFFQDCCADYDDFCVTNLHNTTVNGQDSTHNTSQENLVSQQNRDLWRCYQERILLENKGVWMIGSCPKSWPKDHVFYQCRNLSEANKITKDNYRYLPVYTNNGRVYHNRFCAECNGVSSAELRQFQLIFSCSVLPPEALTQNQRLEFSFSYCDSSDINWKFVPRRYCLSLEEANKQCVNADIKSKCINGTTRVVFIRYPDGNYRNIHCAICSAALGPLECGPQTIDSFYRFIYSFSVIFDFKNGRNNNGNSYIEINCPFQHFYDRYLEVCRKGFTTLPSYSSIPEYQVLLWFRFKPDATNSERRPFMQPNFSDPLSALGDLLQVNSSQVRDLKVSTVSNVMFNLQFNIRFPYQERSKRRFPRQTRSSNSLKTIRFEDILNWTEAADVSVFGQTFTLFKANTRIISCPNLQNYTKNEYTVLQGSGSAFIKATGEILKAKEYYTDAKSANESQAIIVCRLHYEMANCSGVYIVVNEGEFRVLRNKSIFVNASKQLYSLSKYTWQNKSVVVCENFFKHYYKTKNTPNEEVLTTLTLVCMSLSIAGLVFVLVTYSLFSELRTTPGINLMNLSVSILLAQLLWILGSGQTDTPMACTVIAVILHYLFLVSFMWMSIIALDTWKAFSAKGRRPLADLRQQRKRNCLRYMALGWLPAMMHVAICVVLDFTDTVDIGYASDKACWMANRWAILYFFAVPVGLFLVFNIVFCFITFREINVTTAQARAASHHDTRKNFGIYLRIASLMGFTWIFGFAAPFVRQFLWYPFVILNSLQGVYIAFAFALSKQARGLYKRLFSAKFLSGETTNTSTSRSRAKGSEYINEGCDESRL